MNVIPITGDIHSGKTTLAETIQRLNPAAVHVETGSIISEVANEFNTDFVQGSDDPVERANLWIRRLPGVLKNILDIQVSYEQLAFSEEQRQENYPSYQKLFSFVSAADQNPQILEQKILPSNKEVYRSELQWLGNYLVERVDKYIWMKEVKRRLDLAEVQGSSLGLVTAIKYPSEEAFWRQFPVHIVKTVRIDEPPIDKTDPTERQSIHIHPDTTIHNNGTLQEFAKVTENFYEDYTNGSAQSLYFAAS